MRRLPATILVLIGLAGCGGSNTQSVSTAASDSATPTQTATSLASATPSGAAGPCRAVAVPAARAAVRGAPPVLRLNPSRTYTVTVVTNCGTFAFRLDVKQSPKTAASVYVLVRRGFFNGLTFHRVAAGFVIQGGDPSGNGSGGPGYTVVEPPPKGVQYLKGDVAMAKTQTDPPGTSGSQFFIVTAANATQSAGLTPDYALLGKVVSGQSVVDKIGSLPTNPPDDGTPTPAVVMSRVTVTVS